MKKIFFAALFLSLMYSYGTELHVEGVIVNFPCLLKKPDTLSASVIVYACSANNIDFKLHIIKDDQKKDASDYIKEFTACKNGEISQTQNKTINNKTVNYMVASFKKDGADYISESYLYIDKASGITYNMSAIRKKENTQRVDVQIFLNSLIIIN